MGPELRVARSMLSLAVRRLVGPQKRRIMQLLGIPRSFVLLNRELKASSKPQNPGRKQVSSSSVSCIGLRTVLNLATVFQTVALKTKARA